MTTETMILFGVTAAGAAFWPVETKQGSKSMWKLLIGPVLSMFTSPTTTDPNKPFDWQTILPTLIEQLANKPAVKVPVEQPPQVDKPQDLIAWILKVLQSPNDPDEPIVVDPDDPVTEDADVSVLMKYAQRVASKDKDVLITISAGVVECKVTDRVEKKA